MGSLLLKMETGGSQYQKPKGSVRIVIQMKLKHIEIRNDKLNCLLDKDLALPSELWRHLFMENDGWFTDILRDPSISRRRKEEG